MAEKEQWPETGVSTVMYPRGKRERMCQEERMINGKMCTAARIRAPGNMLCGLAPKGLLQAFQNGLWCRGNTGS